MSEAAGAGRRAETGKRDRGMDASPAPPALADWAALRPGQALTVVKLDPSGAEVTRYPGTLVAIGPRPWIAVRAVWTRRLVELDGLRFVPGDTLIEYFSPLDSFNVFAVFAPDGGLRGWYANVTYPTRLETASEPPTLVWHDLYLDVVALPDGTIALRDEDELAAAGVAAREPALHRMILAARADLLARLREAAVPFHDAAGADVRTDVR